MGVPWAKRKAKSFESEEQSVPSNIKVQIAGNFKHTKKPVSNPILLSRNQRQPTLTTHSTINLDHGSGTLVKMNKKALQMKAGKSKSHSKTSPSRYKSPSLNALEKIWKKPSVRRAEILTMNDDLFARSLDSIFIKDVPVQMKFAKTHPMDYFTLGVSWVLRQLLSRKTEMKAMTLRQYAEHKGHTFDNGHVNIWSLAAALDVDRKNVYYEGKGYSVKPVDGAVVLKYSKGCEPFRPELRRNEDGELELYYFE
ncbi:hypothetical protein KJ780_00430 [Candidatus Micrarchaeota archaeon]|nr:hypothetical protein [Candidatus Micrarchaeota archaeon]